MKSGGMISTVLCFLMGNFFTQAQAEIRYTVTDLGTLGGGYSNGYKINNAGQIVGNSRTSEGHDHGFLYDHGSMQDLGMVGEGRISPLAINADGNVAGVLYFDGPAPDYVHACLWENGKITDLHNPDWNLSSVRDLNDQGTMVGYAMSPGAIHPVLWKDGGITVFHDIDGQAFGINNLGQFVGRYRLGAFLYEDNGLTNLGTLGGNGSVATGINDHGQVIGYSDINSNSDFGHPFIWEKGVMRDLGVPDGFQNGMAWDINNLGQIVGFWGTSVLGRPSAGFVYENGKIFDLNTLIDPASGWSITAAQGVNDLGCIVGYGEIDGTEHAYLLTPVPEPSSFLIMGLFFLKLRNI